MRVIHLAVFLATLVQAQALRGETSLRVRILERRHLLAVGLASEQGQRYQLQLRGQELWVDGHTVAVLRVGRHGSRVGVLGLGEGRQYTGILEVRPPRKGEGPGLVLINEVDPVSYVSCVLASETANKKIPLAYARAMARVIWAYRRHLPGRHRSYDACDLTHCQLYRGWSSFSASYEALVREEQAYVWKYGTPLFHRCCGGHLDQAEAIWQGKTGTQTKACELAGRPLCAYDPKYRWNKTVPWGQVSSSISDTLRLEAGPAWKELRIVRRTAGGRAQWLEARSVDGQAFRLGADRFFSNYGRRFGWQHFHSAAIDWQRQGELLLVSGQGFGHGVGLCQSGAQALAQAHWNADRILDFYFFGSESKAPGIKDRPVE